MKHFSILLYCCLSISITSCVTTQNLVDERNLVGKRTTPCNLPFPRTAASEFSYPDATSCGEAAELNFKNTNAGTLNVSFSASKLNENLYMWRGPLNTEVRFVVRPANIVPKIINYWEIEKSTGDGPKEFEKKIKDVIKEFEKSGCGCKAIQSEKETPDGEVINGKKAWRAIIRCPNKNKSPGMGALRVEEDEFGIVINPTYP